MKITSIDPYNVWCGYRDFLFVEVSTDAEIYGASEAALTDRELAVMGAIENFQPLLDGQDSFRNAIFGNTYLDID